MRNVEAEYDAIAALDASVWEFRGRTEKLRASLTADELVRLRRHLANIISGKVAA